MKLKDKNTAARLPSLQAALRLVRTARQRLEYAKAPNEDTEDALYYVMGAEKRLERVTNNGELPNRARGGRPGGSDRYDSHRDLLTRVATLAQELAAENRPVTLKNVAARWGEYSFRGLEHALEREGIAWKPIKANALARARRSSLRGFEGENSP